MVRTENNVAAMITIWHSTKLKQIWPVITWATVGVAGFTHIPHRKPSNITWIQWSGLNTSSKGYLLGDHLQKQLNEIRTVKIMAARGRGVLQLRKILKSSHLKPLIKIQNYLAEMVYKNSLKELDPRYKKLYSKSAFNFNIWNISIKAILHTNKVKDCARIRLYIYFDPIYLTLTFLLSIYITNITRIR